MPSSFSPNLNLELQVTGEDVGTWGDNLNNNVFSIIDKAMGATASVALTNANVTLTTSQTQNAFITLTGTLTANVQVIFPAIGRTYLVRNQTTGNFTVTLAITGGLGATALAERGPGGFFFLDGTNVRALGGLARYRSSAGSTAITAADSGGAVEITSTGTATFDAVATLGSTFRTMIWAPNGATVTLTPNGSETINGAATLILRPGQATDVRCNGVGLLAKVTGNPQSGPQLQGFSSGLGLATSATNAANAVDISVGSAAADTSPYALMQLMAALGKRVDLAWTVGGTPATPLGGLDTGSVANSSYYIWLIQRSDTGVVDALFSLSSTAPTMPTNYDRKRLIGLLIRASATNGAPTVLGRPSVWTDLPAQVLSGSAFTIGSLPSGIMEMIIKISNVTLSAVTSPNVLRIGGASGPVSTGYVGGLLAVSTTANSCVTTTNTTAVLVNYTGASSVRSSTVRLVRIGTGNDWQATVHTTRGDGYELTGQSEVSLTEELTQIQLTTLVGTATFTTGNIAVSYR